MWILWGQCRKAVQVIELDSSMEQKAFGELVDVLAWLVRTSGWQTGGAGM